MKTTNLCGIAICLLAVGCQNRTRIASTAYGPPSDPVLKAELAAERERLEKIRIDSFSVDDSAKRARHLVMVKLLDLDVRTTSILPGPEEFYEKEIESSHVEFSVENVSARELLDRFAQHSPYEWEIMAYKRGENSGAEVVINPKRSKIGSVERRKRWFKIDPPQ